MKRITDEIRCQTISVALAKPADSLRRSHCGGCDGILSHGTHEWSQYFLILVLPIQALQAFNEIAVISPQFQKLDKPHLSSLHLMIENLTEIYLAHDVHASSNRCRVDSAYPVGRDIQQ